MALITGSTVAIGRGFFTVIMLGAFAIQTTALVVYHKHRVDALEANAAHETSELQASLQASEECMQKQREINAAMDAERDKLREQVRALEAEKIRLEGGVRVQSLMESDKQKARDLVHLSTEQEKLRGQYHALQRNYEKVSEAAKNLQASLARKEALLSDMQAALASSQSSNDTLNSSLRIARGRLDQANQEIAKVTNDLVSAKFDLFVQDTFISGMREAKTIYVKPVSPEQR